MIRNDERILPIRAKQFFGVDKAIVKPMDTEDRFKLHIEFDKTSVDFKKVSSFTKRFNLGVQTILVEKGKIVIECVPIIKQFNVLHPHLKTVKKDKNEI